MDKVWALPRSLATTYGIIDYFLFLGVLRCFSSPGYRSPILYIQIGAIQHYLHEVSPFGHLRFKAWLAAPRSLSQLPTSFIGILRLGILCVRLSNFLLFQDKPFGFSRSLRCSFPEGMKFHGINPQNFRTTINLK